MSPRRPPHLCQRALRVLLAVVVALVLPVSASAAGQLPYDHRWQLEGLLTGDVGATARTVIKDSVTLEYAAGRYGGTVDFSDVLGAVDGSKTQAQVSTISLRLEGSALSGGRSAGGAFTGTAVLTTRDAPSLAVAASRDQLALSSGTQVTYDVAGHWAVELTDAGARGELLYQSATPRAGATGPSRGAAWFNRSSLAQPDGLGDAQRFTVRVTGVTAPSPAPVTQPTTRPAGTSPVPADQPAAPTLSPIDYIVRGLTGRRSLTPVPAASEQVRAARALRDAAVPNVVALPTDAITVDLDVAGAYLDAKNRASALLGDSGPIGDYVASARAAAAAARSAVPGRAAPGADADAGTTYARDLVRVLAPQVVRVAGARTLSDDAASIRPGAPAVTVARLRSWLAVVEALAADNPFGSVIAPAAASAKAVAQGRLPQTGALADAVLAAADSPEAPVGALAVTDFAREPSADVSALATASTNGAVPSIGLVSEPASAGVNALPREVLARAALGSASDGALPAITYDAGGQQRVAPATWLAYARADGTRFWLAGDGGLVALTDASLRGWAWSARRAALVDATRVGRTLALFDLR